MAESLDVDLLAISVDADDYAETAAGDVTSVSRTYQSDADFQAQKASYSAKIDNGNIYSELLKAIPQLSTHAGLHEKGVLSKKDFQLLGYAIGEMYFDGKDEEVVALCGRVRERCLFDEAKVGVALDRWTGRCRGRMKMKDAGE